MTDNNSVIRESAELRSGSPSTGPTSACHQCDVVAGIAGLCDAHDDRDVRVIVLTAGDKAFCAARPADSGAAFAMDFAKPNVDCRPVAAVAERHQAGDRAGRGVCMAGAWAVVHDRLWRGTDHVIFGLPEVKVGVFPSRDGAAAVDRAAAPVNEWSLTGERSTPGQHCPPDF